MSAGHVTLDDLTLDDLGLAATTEALIDQAHAMRVAATLDVSVDLTDGSVLPSLWHWTYFTPTTATAGLGPDGHVRLTSPVVAPYPRRMWGAGEVTWHADLRVGAPAVRTTTLASVKHTEGASGALLIVGLQHHYHQHDALIIEEEQSIVYRGEGDPVTLPLEGPMPQPEPGVNQREGRPDPALLFRFSAVTFNTHRIHYDLAYATDIEGYPALVVHGPLTSLQLAQHVESTHARALASWRFKATAPMFCNGRQWFQCGPADRAGDGEARVLRADGIQAMSARYRLRAHHG